MTISTVPTVETSDDLLTKVPVDARSDTVCESFIQAISPSELLEFLLFFGSEDTKPRAGSRTVEFNAKHSKIRLAKGRCA